jgi:hypothetical protein
MSKSTALAMPPLTQTSAGRERRVGVEIEFSGLTIAETAQRVRAVLFGAEGGELQYPGRYEITLHGDPAGDWQVELDYAFLKRMGRRERGDGDLGDAVEGLAEDLLRMVAERIVPVEVVSPPLPMSRLGELNRLIEALRAAGARGTADDPTYAFGMQLNPEVPATDVDCIRHYLQAFLCLEDWLRERAAVDWTRRLTFFADPFPKAYARIAVAPGYAPDRARLIDDYLEANPTRNRALDMLPLFAYLDEARVRAWVKDERVKARPTFHYRLPNSEVDRADWDLSVPWADWLVVERLASEPALLERLCATYSDYLGDAFERWTSDWKQDCQRWLSDNALL